MKIFGSISELVDLAFRLAGGKQVRILSNSQTSSTSDIITIRVPDVGATGDEQNIILTQALQTLTNKTLSSPTISGGTINNAVIGGSNPAAGSFTDIVGSSLDISGSSVLNSLQIDGISTAGLLHSDATGNVSSSLLVNADVDASAAISFSKLESLPQNNILLGSGTGVPTAVGVKAGSDISITYDAGEADIQIVAGSVGNNELAEDILRSKLAAGNNNRILVNDGTGEISENSALTPNEVVASDANGLLTTIAGVSSTELGYLDGVSSGIQSQLDGKEPTILGAATSITQADLLVNRALVSDGSGKVGVSPITSTELGYLDNVSSNIQSQLDGKVDENTAITGGTFPKITFDSKGLVTSGSALSASDIPTAIDATKIATGVVSNTEFNYLNGVTSAIQTQLDSKLSAADAVTISDSQTITGAKIFTSDVTIEDGKKLKFFEPNANGENFISFRTAGIAANTEYVLPSSDGVAGNVLGTDGAGNLQWQGAGALPDTVADQALVIGQTGNTYGTLPKGANNEVLTVNASGNLEYVFLTNANISASAGISYSKLSLTGSIVNADIASAAAISGSKINPNFGAQTISTTGNASIGGTLDVRGAIDLADNDILRFGSSDDVELFFNGTNMYMDLNLGDFIIRDGTTTRFTFDDAGSFTATGNIAGAQATTTAHMVRADRTLTAGDGLSGGGNLTANRTLAVDSTVARTNVAETFSSSVTAASFSGNGSSLTNLNASAISSGTIASARLPLATGSSAGAIPYYEEGTWSPSINTLSNLQAIAGNTITFGEARYTRLGNLVIATLSNIENLEIGIDDAQAGIQLSPTGLPGITNDTYYYGNFNVRVAALPREPLTTLVTKSSAANNLIYLQILTDSAVAINGDDLSIYGLTIQYYID